jgi:hypothetical protein
LKPASAIVFWFESVNTKFQKMSAQAIADLLYQLNTDQLPLKVDAVITEPLN